MQDRDIRTLAREQHGDSAPDTRVATGDERDLAFELARALVERGVVHRRRVELRFAARLGLMLFPERRNGIGAGAGLHRLGLLLRPRAFGLRDLLLDSPLLLDGCCNPFGRPGFGRCLRHGSLLSGWLSLAGERVRAGTVPAFAPFERCICRDVAVSGLSLKAGTP